jgi:hypothetical protein
LKPAESHSGMHCQGMSWYLGDATLVCFCLANLGV